jgi:predicted RNA polymerase sigma factor
VLPSRADAGVGDRADPARGRRADDREIARAFLVDEPTMAQRIAGRSSGSSVRRAVPDAEARRAPGRCARVLHVLYLIFNEGYQPRSGRSCPTRASARAMDEALALPTIRR